VWANAVSAAEVNEVFGSEPRPEAEMIIAVLVSLTNAKIYGLLGQLFVIQLMEKFFVVP
jgi:hypothetical protein